MKTSTVPDLPLAGRGELRTLTVRSIPAEVDLAITEQAKLAGRSKSDYLQEFLVATFGDLIGNFIRTSELVALMDREMARMMGTELKENTYNTGLTLDGHREFCRVLGILSEAELQRIMMGSAPYLSIRAQQLDTGIPLLPQGISLTCALFIDAAGRELADLFVFRRNLFWFVDEEQFRVDVDAIRQARLLPPLAWPEF